MSILRLNDSNYQSKIDASIEKINIAETYWQPLRLLRMASHNLMLDSLRDDIKGKGEYNFTSNFFDLTIKKTKVLEAGIRRKGQKFVPVTTGRIYSSVAIHFDWKVDIANEVKETFEKRVSVYLKEIGDKL